MPRPRLALLLAFALFAPGCARSPAPAPPEPESVLRARYEAHMAAGRWHDAVLTARAWMRDWPAAVEPYSLEGPPWGKLSADPAKRAELAARVERTPDCFGLDSAALFLQDAGKLAEARALADRAVQLFPDDHHSWEVRGILEAALGLDGAAEASFTEAMRRSVSDPWPFWWMARFCLERARPTDAARFAGEGLKRPFQPMQLVELRARALRAAGRPREAIDELAVRRALHPKDDELAWLLAEAMAAHGAYAELTALAPKLSISQQRRIPGLIAGWMELRQDYRSRQRCWLETARRVDPQGSETRAAAALIGVTFEAPLARIEADVAAAVAAAPQAFLTRMASARLLELRARTDPAQAAAAEQAYRDVAAGPEQSAVPLIVLFEMLKKGPRLEVALAALDQALAREPANTGVRVRAARFHLDAGRPPPALALLTSIPAEAQVPAMRALSGRAHEDRGDRTRAEVALRDAFAKGYDDAGLMWRLKRLQGDRSNSLPIDVLTLEERMNPPAVIDPAPYPLLPK